MSPLCSFSRVSADAAFWPAVFVCTFAFSSAEFVVCFEKELPLKIMKNNHERCHIDPAYDVNKANV